MLFRYFASCQILDRHDLWLHQDIRPYWSIKDDLAVIDGVIMKGRCILIPEAQKQHALNQLHFYHMGIEKNKTISMQIHLLG